MSSTGETMSIAARNILVVFVGGGIGAIARYLSVMGIKAALGSVLAWGTLTVNLVGSFLIGAASALVDRQILSESLRLALMTGVLGGFTTFSAFSLETLAHLTGGSPLKGVLEIVLNVGGGIFLAALGYAVARRMLG